MAAIDDLDWDDLRYFLKAAQAKTLVGAARAMGVEHTTIGRRPSALERSLGAALVLRGPDGLTLTPLGEKVMPMIQDIERDVRKVFELAASQTLLPCYLGDREQALVRLSPAVLATRNVSLVYRRETRLAAPVRAVIAFVVEAMREHEELLRGARAS